MGDDIPDAGKLVGVFKDHAIILNQGRRTSLEMPTDQNGAPAEIPSPFGLPGRAFRRNFLRGRSSENEPHQNGVRQIDPNHYVLARTTLDNNLSNMASLFTQVRAIPNLGANGQSNGFKLSEIQPDSIFQQIGLRDGDVLTDVSGQSVSDPDQGDRVVEHLAQPEFDQPDRDARRPASPAPVQHPLTMELRPARSSERDQVLDLLALWYGDRDFFARYNRYDPGFRDELCLVACEGGRIVATAQIFDRRVNLRGAAVAMGGIGSVYTMESYRGRGLGSALMQLGGHDHGTRGFEVSLLFAERLDFYARFGWRAGDAPVQRARRHPDDAHICGVSARGFEQARDLGEVAALHRDYSGRFDGTVMRDLDEWRGNLRYAGNPGEYFIVCRRDEAGELTAYARAMQVPRLSDGDGVRLRGGRRRTRWSR